MWKRFLPVVVLVAGLFAAAFGQGERGPSLERFLRDSWKAVRTEGVRALPVEAHQWPTELRSIRTTVRQLLRRAQDSPGVGDMLGAMALTWELWQARAGLDLLALLRPETIRQITGISSRDIARLKQEIDAGLGLSPAKNRPGKPTG
jgi:hypothetical protein